VATIHSTVHFTADTLGEARVHVHAYRDEHLAAVMFDNVTIQSFRLSPAEFAGIFRTLADRIDEQAQIAQQQGSEG
jgi:folylpolyglutamate synthase/dihydropteroate synthase